MVRGARVRRGARWGEEGGWGRGRRGWRTWVDGGGGRKVDGGGGRGGGGAATTRAAGEKVERERDREGNEEEEVARDG